MLNFIILWMCLPQTQLQYSIPKPAPCAEYQMTHPIGIAVYYTI